jgi:hypothetical protein
MTRKSKRPAQGPLALEADAIGGIENITGPGESALAQQAARKHILVNEAAAAISLAIGGPEGNFIELEPAMNFDGL